MNVLALRCGLASVLDEVLQWTAQKRQSVEVWEQLLERFVEELAEHELFDHCVPEEVDEAVVQQKVQQFHSFLQNWWPMVSPQCKSDSYGSYPDIPAFETLQSR